MKNLEGFSLYIDKYGTIGFFGLFIVCSFVQFRAVLAYLAPVRPGQGVAAIFSPHSAAHRCSQVASRGAPIEASIEP